MKKIISGIVLFLSVSFFSSPALAEVLLKMNGTGSVIEAVKAFNKAVAINNGIVAVNNQTEFSSVGEFGDYRAKMYAEEKEGKVSIRITVTRERAELLAYALSGGKNQEMDIALKIGGALEKDGYK